MSTMGGRKYLQTPAVFLESKYEGLAAGIDSQIFIFDPVTLSSFDCLKKPYLLLIDLLAAG